MSTYQPGLSTSVSESCCFIFADGALIGEHVFQTDQNGRSFYVCAFANNQWNLAAELGSCVEECPFYKVLMSARDP